jgi:hypothetical protein
MMTCTLNWLTALKKNKDGYAKLFWSQADKFKRACVTFEETHFESEIGEMIEVFGHKQRAKEFVTAQRVAYELTRV